jgi:hypothetical protein
MGSRTILLRRGKAGAPIAGAQQDKPHANQVTSHNPRNSKMRDVACKMSETPILQWTELLSTVRGLTGCSRNCRWPCGVMDTNSAS